LITEQYLEYIEWMKAMNMDFAGEFLVMAATLTQIKSRMLLPAHEGEDAEEEFMQEVTRPLQEYLQMKSVAEQLSLRPLLGENIFTRHPATETFLDDGQAQFIKVGLFELIDAFQKILENIPTEHRIDLSAERISVKERIRELVEILENKGTVTFEELFPALSGRGEIVVSFLAILEMVKLGLVRIAQHVQTGIIRLFYV